MIDKQNISDILIREWDTSLRIKSCGLLKSGIMIGGISLYVGFDSRTGCCIGIPVSDSEEIGAVMISGSVCLETVYNDQAGKILMLSCFNSGLKELFAVFCSEFLDALSLSSEDIKETAVNLIIEWRELFGAGSAVYNINMLTGLIGELLLIKKLSADIPQIFKAWQGPEGSAHDFRFERKSIEVKTSLIRSRTIIKAHGLYQFDIKRDEELVLAFCRLEKVNSGGFSAEELISELESGFSSGTKNSLDEMIKDMSDDLLNRRYRLLEFRMYKVDDSFPRLTVSDFKNNSLPSGITNISYTADLSDCKYTTLDDWLNNESRDFCPGGDAEV